MYPRHFLQGSATLGDSLLTLWTALLWLRRYHRRAGERCRGVHAKIISDLGSEHIET